MKPWVRACSCALGIGVWGGVAWGPARFGTPVAAAEEAQPNAGDCVSFSNDVRDKSIVVHAANLCEKKLECELSWHLRCEDNQGKTTAQSSGSAHFPLVVRGTQETEMSAATCRQGWEIDRVAWSCR